MNTQTQTAPLPAALRSALGLQEQFEQLGLNLNVWDGDGTLLGPCRHCRVGHVLHAGSEEALPPLRDLVKQVLLAGKSCQGQGTHGCCIVALSLAQRRRTIGVATVCFPTGQVVAAKEFRSACRKASLDAQGVGQLVSHGSRRGLKDAREVETLANWFIERAVAASTTDAELAGLSANLSTTYEELSLLYRISSQMKVTAPPQDFIQDVCHDLAEVMDIQAAAGIVYAHPPALQDDAVVLAGNIDLNLDQIRMLITHIGSLLSGQNEPVLVNDFVAAPDSGVGSAVKTFIAAPLMTEGHLIGLLMAINKKDGDFDSGDSKLLHSISDQASVFLVNHRLYADLQDLLMGVLHALTATIDAKDPYTRGHSQRVALLSRKLAKGYGMGPAKVQQIYLAGLLHDIGKIGVPEAVLCKEGRLTAEEYETIKRHPAIGAKILQGIRQLEEVVGGILTHHERPDGRGYPHGLHGADVPIEGRIVGLADVFDAMTSDRTYRKALKLEDTVAEIQRCAGAQFDQSLVNLLMSFDFPLLMEELRQCNSPAGGLFGIGRQEVVA